MIRERCRRLLKSIATIWPKPGMTPAKWIFWESFTFTCRAVWTKPSKRRRLILDNYLVVHQAADTDRKEVGLLIQRDAKTQIAEGFVLAGDPQRVADTIRKWSRTQRSNDDLRDISLRRHAAGDGAEKHSLVRRESHAAVQVETRIHKRLVARLTRSRQPDAKNRVTRIGRDCIPPFLYPCLGWQWFWNCGMSRKIFLYF